MTDAAEIVGQPGRARTEPTEQWRLHDEREFLQRSLEDAEREHAAGDLADADYVLLRRRDEARLAAVDAALAALDDRPPADASSAGGDTGASSAGAGDGATTSPADGPTAGAAGAAGTDRAGGGRPRRKGRQPGVRRRRRWLALGGVACVVAGAVVLAVQLAAPRLPGQAPTGSIDLSQAQRETRQLQQAQSLVNGGHPSKALQVYGQVLSEDPSNPVALAEWGWLEWQAASAAKQENAAADGQAAVAKAVKLEPSLYAAQYYLGAIYLDQGNATQAVAHFRRFLSDHPSSTWRQDAAPVIRKAFGDAGQAVPAGVPAAGSPST